MYLNCVFSAHYSKQNISKCSFHNIAYPPDKDNACINIAVDCFGVKCKKQNRTEQKSQKYW